ncbi:putative metalloprotease CJM1_0395 family protein [Sulfurivirga sp.]|uniref:putative metalloprotease CJM1_0395 family protein n=1 Tax=Sulfurivirga sp. TaxID=2614236 RepID=UPI0025E3CC5C|nr:putative metalloprotease CJM1_0395 family protein [Sulfurivirga sp.]
MEGKRRGQSDRTSLSPEAQRQLERLRARDREVRAHEMAHLAAAGGYATSGMQLTYETGPDGRQYAVGGEVGIDVSPGRTPEETIAKMQVVQRAALAPAEPSPQDQRVAALAAQQMAQAAVELSRREVGGAEDESATDRQGIGRTAEKRVGKVVNDNPLVAAGIEARQAWQTRLRLQA